MPLTRLIPLSEALNVEWSQIYFSELIRQHDLPKRLNVE